MSKRHMVMLIIAFGTAAIFLMAGFASDYLSPMKFKDRELWNKSMGMKNNCFTVARIKNVTIKVGKRKENITKHLNVYVILHSHVDAGWLYTFEEYYSTAEHSVRQIINNVVNSLRKHPKLRFIWSEVSFLERWWSEANATYRNYFKNLTDEGRLEISGGLWVMNDEATPYFWETIENIIVGHQYLQKKLNITPTTSWSVDPFGHGLMMPYLLSLADINRMVICRINTDIKNVLKQSHQLHFRWRQKWDSQLRWTPFVNVLPNDYYTVSSGCGNDETICCQFDVAKTSRSFCTERAQVNNAQQIALYGERMANQYRSLQTFYNSGTVLVAAGDDFLYSDPDDLEIVHRVYSTLFRYINRNYNRFKMNVKFGTVKEYFDGVKEGRKSKTSVLDGDFFPYIDNPLNKAPVWTGFYNHRTYFKCFERIIQSELRLADLLSVATRIYPKSDLELARRNLALSIHHDAITGTSKRYVMDDYMLSYKIQIVNQKGFSVVELIKLNISTPFVTVTYGDKTLTAQVVPLIDEIELFEAKDNIVLKNQFFTILWNVKSDESHRIIYNDGTIDAKFGLYFNQVVDYGGAYTMVAKPPFQNISNQFRLPAFVIQGPIYSSIWQRLSPQLAYRITVINSTDNSARSFQTEIFSNVGLMAGYTFFMNLNTNIKNNANFYTDVNGMYLIKRRYDRRKKFEANIYPMVTELMIEDDELRCTILSAQSTGATSKLGVLTVMLDREMDNDDGKGLPYQEASESYPSHLKYRIIFESKISSLNSRQKDNASRNNRLPRNTINTIYHSQLVQQNLEELLYPAALFLSSNASSTNNNDITLPFINLPRLPDNIQLITARYIALKTILISMRLIPYDCSVISHLISNTEMV
uniref:Glycoside hydrolase family 38 central domain-containing protein n=1 Tax=Setaria digitata TaxID=48799 RepID=A0A915PMT6_9BILA